MKKALDWYDAGITPLPIPVGKKYPPNVKWRRWQAERPRRAMVETWFKGKERNVGLVLGPTADNLTVLDFDLIPTYYHWRYEHKHYLANSYTVRTSRGFHVYLYTDAPTARTFALKNVDVKATGYILAESSIHPDGAVYRAHVNNVILRTTRIENAIVGLERVRRPNIKGEVVISVAGDLVMNLSPQATIPSFTFGTQDSLNHIKLPRDIARRIKQHLTILELASRYTDMQSSDDSGNWYIGRCPHPGHEDKHPSFSLSLRNQRANCKTPTCGLHSKNGLDVIDLVGALEGLGPRDAMASLGIGLGLIERPG